MSRSEAQIMSGLKAVAAERAQRLAEPALATAVKAVKHYQHARFGHTYADLMAQDRYARAAEFFLTDLYGPADFTDRDSQFARVVPALVRLFPERIVQTVAELSELHALSERLDTAMARRALQREEPLTEIQGNRYGELWREVGEPAQRERQIGLMVSVGESLDGFTRSVVLRQTLRMMRAPAAAAGLGALQGFLERGFDTFRDMKGADYFLTTIAARERVLASELFAGAAGPDVP